jgi:F420-dependent oxidoreductase-like protein
MDRQPTGREDEAPSLARRYCLPEQKIRRTLRSLHTKGITMAASNTLSFGIKTRPQWTTYDDLVRVWREADEEPRFEHAWLFDHFQPLGPDPTGPCLEGWTLLAALAAQTTRLRLGVMVTGITYRHPAVLANMAATVDHIAHGRLDFGVGASWKESEHTSYGIPFYPAGERIRRLGEACEVIRLLWTEQTATFAGQYYQLTEARCEPKPVQQPHPPVVIGGHGERLTLRVVAQHADIWNTVPDSAEEYQRKYAALEAHCAAIGRDPTTIERSVQVLADLSHPEATCEFIAALITAGASHIVVESRPPFPPGIVRHVAEVIVEPVRRRMRDAGVGVGE